MTTGFTNQAHILHNNKKQEDDEEPLDPMAEKSTNHATRIKTVSRQIFARKVFKFEPIFQLIPSKQVPTERLSDRYHSTTSFIHKNRVSVVLSLQALG